VEGGVKEEEGTKEEKMTAQLTGKPLAEIQDRWSEVNLFSEVVFQDVSLRDTGLQAVAKFEMPIKRLWVLLSGGCGCGWRKTGYGELTYSYDKHLYPADVRAAISLIPVSPSKLGRIANLTHWMPDDVVLRDRLPKEWVSWSTAVLLDCPGPLNLFTRPPDRIWLLWHTSFDPRSTWDLAQGDSTVQHQAIHFMASSFGILEFHEVLSQCEDSADGELAVEETGVDVDVSMGDLYDFSAPEKAGHIMRWSYRPTSPRKSHPHLVAKWVLFVAGEGDLGVWEVGW
jgi:hypothetical protein